MSTIFGRAWLLCLVPFYHLMSKGKLKKHVVGWQRIKLRSDAWRGSVLTMTPWSFSRSFTCPPFNFFSWKYFQLIFCFVLLSPFQASSSSFKDSQSLENRVSHSDLLFFFLCCSFVTPDVLKATAAMNTTAKTAAAAATVVGFSPGESKVKGWNKSHSLLISSLLHTRRNQ